MDTSERAAMEVQEAVERRIRVEYRKAQRELTDKLHGYIEAHKAREAKYRALVASGKMSQEDFDAWMQGQIFQSKQWMRMRDSVAKTLYQADVSAQKIVNGERGNIFAQSANHTLYDLEHETGVTFGFELYDQSTVAKILREQPRLLPPKKVAEAKDIAWYQHKINSVVVQGIIQGEGIGQIASRVGRETGELSRNAMLRNARTAMTSAHSAGKLDAMHAMKERGIDVKKRWVATLDLKTRPAHASLDGVEVDIDEPFTTPMGDIERPGDPNAPACLVFNCRCMLFSVFGKYPASYTRRDMNGEMVKDMTYEEWAKAHGYGTQPKQPEEDRVVVQGTDISGTWTRRKDKFEFEINDVLNAQGFDGLPRVVDPEEFDRMVEESHFIAQRTYTAADQAQVDLYQDMLYNGDWYVACTTGGAQYGQGMYCAADYTGTLTDGIREEMEHYKGLYDRKFGEVDEEQVSKAIEVAIGRDRADAEKWGYVLDEKERREYYRWQMVDMKMAGDVIEAQYGIKGHNFLAFSHTETLTLDPSAKIITYDDALKLRSQGYAKARVRKVYDTLVNDDSVIGEIATKLSAISHETVSADKAREMMFSRFYADIAPNEDSPHDEWTKFRQKYKIKVPQSVDIWGKYGRMIDDAYHNALNGMDVGSVAALYGYDAINAEGHGESGSYTVILNRTKVIFRRGA